MSCLAPCPACDRHIAIDETTCPFCVARLPDSFREANACRRSPPARLSRAARLAAGAALIGVQASCGSSAYGTAVPYDSGVVDARTIDGGDDGTLNDSAVALNGGAPAQLDPTPPASDGTPLPHPRRK
jgi:hypothetical protein